jgi:hypothetical protein
MYAMPPQLRPRGRRWLVPVLMPILAGVAGIAVGATTALTGAGRTTEVPQACLDAIDIAEQGFGATADAMTGMQGAFIALGEADDAALEQATEDVNLATDRMHALTPGWDAARTDCRAAAR